MARAARLEQQQTRMGAPPPAALRGEQPLRGLCPGGGQGRFPGGQRGPGAGQQQLGPSRGPAAAAARATERGVRLGKGVGGQPGRKQYGAPVRGELKQRHGKLAVPVLGLVQAGQRRGQVPRAIRDEPAVVPGESHLDGLAAGGVEVLGASQVQLGTVPGATGQVNQCPGGAGPCLEEAVTRRPQHPDRAPQVVQCLGVPPEHPQRDAPAHQDPGRGLAGDQGEGTVQRGQAAAAVAPVGQRDAQRGQHVGLALRGPGGPGEAHRGAQLRRGRVQLAELPV